MKQPTFIRTLAATAILALAWVTWLTTHPQADQPPPHPAVTAASRSPRSPATAPYPANSSASRRRADPSREAASTRSVRADDILAKINETPIQLRDLIALSPGESKIEMTHQQYASRLRRAVEAELTFQAARAQGVELTPVQQQRVDKVGATDQSDLEHYKQYGVTWSSGSAEQVEFEKRMLTAQLLEQNLVARAASVSPSPDPAVQARYEHARRSLLDQLQASANLSEMEPGR